MHLIGEDKWKSQVGQGDEILQEIAHAWIGIPIQEPAAFHYTTSEGKPLNPLKTLKENGVTMGMEIRILPKLKGGSSRGSSQMC